MDDECGFELAVFKNLNGALSVSLIAKQEVVRRVEIGGRPWCQFATQRAHVLRSIPYRDMVPSSCAVKNVGCLFSV